MAVTVDSDITGISSGGGISASGTPVAAQLGIWSSASAQRGDAALTLQDDANNFILSIVDTKSVQVGFSVANDGTGPVRCTFAVDIASIADVSHAFSNQNQIWAYGLDNSNDDKFVWSAGGSLGSTDALRLGVDGSSEIVGDGAGIGFFGSAATTQPAAQADVAGGAIIDAEVRASHNALLAKLRTLGIIDT